mgnify:CR=1 FL=1
MVTFKTKNYEATLGYFGFFNLRAKIAGLISPELEELYKEYCVRGLPRYSDEKYELENKRIKEQYETKVNEICKNPDYEKVFDFLYMSDCDGKIGVRYCKAIYKVIKGYEGNDDYEGCHDIFDPDIPFTFNTFKEIIKDGIDSKKGVKWY